MGATPDGRPPLTRDRVLYLLEYDPETGVFTWLRPASNRMKPGQVAGSPNDLGYIYLTIDGRKYRANRVAWLVIHGEWPAREVDHENTDRADNSRRNLRETDRSGNMLNQRGPRADNRGGVLGVRQYSDGRFGARITVDGRFKWLGTFDTSEQASESYKAAKWAAMKGRIGAAYPGSSPAETAQNEEAL